MLAIQNPVCDTDVRQRAPILPDILSSSMTINYPIRKMKMTTDIYQSWMAQMTQIQVQDFPNGPI